MAESTLALWQETALKVRELQVRFDAFETENKMSDSYFNELDEEMEEGRVNIEKLEKRVRELEIDLPELISEKVATLKTENTELRIHLNLLVDAVNNLTTIWNEQVHEGEQQTEVVDEQSTEDTPQLTLQQVYNMYQSQPPDEEGWEEMTNEIEAAEKYEARFTYQNKWTYSGKNGTTY